MSHHSWFHGFSSPWTVPFSWEDKPGISKESPIRPLLQSPREGQEKALIMRLPPPPCPSDSPKLPAHGLYVPLPPCPFQPPPLKRRLRREDDPFLAAYLECTKSVKETKERNKRGGGFGFSCKHVTGVKEDAIMRLSRFTASLHPREEFMERRSPWA